MARKVPSLGLAGYSGAKFTTADEARYRAEDDVRTLAKAHEIRSDKARFKMAQNHAVNVAKAVQKGK